MNKTELVKYVSRKSKLPQKQAWTAVDWTLDGIKRYTRTREGVRLSGFGNFKCTEQKKERKYNPRTKRYTWTKPQKHVQFTPTKIYREWVK